MKIEHRNVEELKEYKNNTKLHPEEQIDQIIKSINEFGFNDPIAVDENDVIIEGHGRHMAAVKMGLTKVPTIKLSHLSENNKRAYIIAHNKLTMNSDFDMDKLSEELGYLNDLETDFNLELTGFESLEAELIIHKIDGDVEPEPDDKEEGFAQKKDNVYKIEFNDKYHLEKFLSLIQIENSKLENESLSYAEVLVNILEENNKK